MWKLIANATATTLDDENYLLAASFRAWWIWRSHRVSCTLHCLHLDRRSSAWRSSERFCLASSNLGFCSRTQWSAVPQNSHVYTSMFCHTNTDLQWDCGTVWLTLLDLTGGCHSWRRRNLESCVVRTIKLKLHDRTRVDNVHSCVCELISLTSMHNSNHTPTKRQGFQLYLSISKSNFLLFLSRLSILFTVFTRFHRFCLCWCNPSHVSEKVTEKTNPSTVKQLTDTIANFNPCEWYTGLPMFDWDPGGENYPATSQRGRTPRNPSPHASNTTTARRSAAVTTKYSNVWCPNCWLGHLKTTAAEQMPTQGSGSVYASVKRSAHVNIKPNKRTRKYGFEHATGWSPLNQKVGAFPNIW